MPRTLVTSTSIAGIIHPFAGTTAPTGWLICDGAAVSRTTYSELFSVIGTTHGSGDGSNTFNIPDYRGRFLRGVDGGTGRDPDSVGTVSATVTISIATPALITQTGHGYSSGDPIVFSTTGALPTGITAGTRYFVVPNNINSYYIAASMTPGHSSLWISTSGTQSGVHTITNLSKRTAMNPGGNTGNAVGSIQSDQVRSHAHTMNTIADVQSNVNYTGTGFNPLTNDSRTGHVYPRNTGGQETRPINAYVNYIIKI